MSIVTSPAGTQTGHGCGFLRASSPAPGAHDYAQACFADLSSSLEAISLAYGPVELEMTNQPTDVSSRECFGPREQGQRTADQTGPEKRPVGGNEVAKGPVRGSLPLGEELQQCTHEAG